MGDFVSPILLVYLIKIKSFFKKPSYIIEDFPPRQIITKVMFYLLPYSYNLGERFVWITLYTKAGIYFGIWDHENVSTDLQEVMTY